MSPDEQIQIMKLAAEELEDTSSALITGVTSNILNIQLNWQKWLRK